MPVSERSGINQSSPIEGDILERDLTSAVREGPLDEHILPNLESGADAAMEFESASDYPPKGTFMNSAFSQNRGSN